MSKNELKAMALPIILNSVVIICFTILAIVFHKWWISLLSMIFWNSISYKSKNGGKSGESK